MDEVLRIVFVVVLILGVVAFLIAWVVAEVRAAIWMRTPPTDPWVKHRVN